MIKHVCNSTSLALHLVQYVLAENPTMSSHSYQPDLIQKLTKNDVDALRSFSLGVRKVGFHSQIFWLSDVQAVLYNFSKNSPRSKRGT